MSVANQRSEARYTCFVPVEGKEGSAFDQTKTLDISRHGIGFLSSHPIAINQKIALEIVLKPNTEPIMVIGVVKWVRKIGVTEQYRVGMVFSEIVSGSGTRLQKYLSSKGSPEDDRTRMFERFSARFPVKFKDAREDYGVDVFLRDASALGARILTKERFFLDDQLALEVELPDGGQPMVLSGRVVWAKFLNLSMWNVGLQFNQVDFLKMQRLFKLTESSSAIEE